MACSFSVPRASFDHCRLQQSAWQIPASKLPPSLMKSATNPRLHSAEHLKNLLVARRANGDQCLPEQQYPRMSASVRLGNVRRQQHLFGSPPTADGSRSKGEAELGFGRREL